MTTILVIENEHFIRANIVELLESEGFFVLGAEDGFEAMSLLGRHRPDLILCDVLMPEFSGYDVLHDVRARPDLAQIPFVFLSAESSQENTTQGLVSGADHYLAKPFSIRDLLDVVYSFVERPT